MTTVSFPAQVRAVHANLHSVTLCLDVDAFADIYGWLGVDHGIANPTVPGGPFRVSLDGVDRVFPRLRVERWHPLRLLFSAPATYRGAALLFRLVGKTVYCEIKRRPDQHDLTVRIESP